MKFENTQNPLNLDLRPTPLNLGRQDWRVPLDGAIPPTGEEAIWEGLSSQQNDGAAHAALVNMVSRLTYQRAGINIYCELFMMPVLAPAGGLLIQEKEVWLSVRPTARDALIKWLNKEVALTIFEGILPMDWITTWRPQMIRSHLNRLLPGSERLTCEFPSTKIDLPQDAPRLGFVVMAYSSRTAWPGIPEACTLRDQRLTDVIRYALQMSQPNLTSDRAPVPLVLLPDRLQFSVTAGIVCWLMRLHETIGIEGWALVPSHATPDRVQITIRLKSEEVPRSQFSIRMHQIGLHGFHTILSALGACAEAMDSSQRQ